MGLPQLITEEAMTVNRLYDTWFAWVCQLWPQQRVTCQRNVAWFLTGLFQGRSVQLPRVAAQIPGPAKLLSRVRRLSRFLDNSQLRVRPSYAPIARRLLEDVAQTVGEIRLIADGTLVGFSHQLLLISVAYRRRAIPLAWTWIPSAKGHSSAWKQRALLAYVHRLIPAGIPVLLLGDTEFEAVSVQRQVAAWHWSYVLRQKPNNQVRAKGQATWHNFGSLVQRPGQSVWLAHAQLTLKSPHSTNLLAHWQAGEKEAWLLATNLPTPGATLRAYRRRMWTEELFGDLKGHGFDLASTHLLHFERLSRLTLLVALVYVWLLLAGARVIRRGERHWVDRRDRRDLSLFQIGWRLIERHLINSNPLPLALKPISILKLSGG
jgi:hypothetical protein